MVYCTARHHGTEKALFSLCMPPFRDSIYRKIYAIIDVHCLDLRTWRKPLTLSDSRSSLRGKDCRRSGKYVEVTVISMPCFDPLIIRSIVL